MAASSKARSKRALAAALVSAQLKHPELVRANQLLQMRISLLEQLAEESALVVVMKAFIEMANEYKKQLPEIISNETTPSPDYVLGQKDAIDAMLTDMEPLLKKYKGAEAEKNEQVVQLLALSPPATHGT